MAAWYEDAPDCAHDHERGYADCVWAWTHSMCVLPSDHEGPHEFAPQDEIVLSFPARATAAE